MTKKLKEIIEKSTRKCVENQVKEGKELAHLERTWKLRHQIISYQFNEGRINYTISPWEDVENLINDKYLDLYIKSTIKNSFEKKVDVLMKVYKIINEYTGKIATGHSNIPIFEEFINSTSFKKSI